MRKFIPLGIGMLVAAAIGLQLSAHQVDYTVEAPPILERCFVLEQSAVRGWYDARADVLNPGHKINWTKLQPIIHAVSIHVDMRRRIFLMGSFYMLGVEDYADGITRNGVISHVQTILGCK